jgi:hypothetical protein
VANENDGTVTGAIQCALYRRHVILKRGQRVLNRNGVELLSVGMSNDFAPAGTVGPPAVGENDSRLRGCGHFTLLYCLPAQLRAKGEVEPKQGTLLRPR